MKVLAAVETVSFVRFMPGIVRELEARGHEVTVFAHWFSEADYEKFRGCKGEIRRWGSLSPRAVRKYDAAFMPHNFEGYWPVVSSDVYTFSYTGHLTHFANADMPDFMFLPHGNLTFDYARASASMPVGYVGGLDSAAERVLPDSKRFLYIDSGHMPFGDAGKTQVARLLLEICRKFPEHELCIKPRWLRSDSPFEPWVTHRNAQHIYNIIEGLCGGAVPGNLNMLGAHYRLQDLVECSDVVLSLYTTAAMQAIIQGKPLVTLGGWENEHELFLSKKFVARLEKWHGETGCVAHIDAALEHLPRGLECAKEFIGKYLPHRGDAAKRIADVMEYVHGRFLAKGEVPDAGSYSYEDYKETMRGGNMSFARLKRNRYREIGLYPARALCLQAPADMDYFGVAGEIEDFIAKHEPMTKRGFNGLLRLRKDSLDALVIKNRALFMQDDISQSFLFEALFSQGRLGEIAQTKNVLCKGPHYYYCAVHCNLKGEREAALDFFVKYLADANSRHHQRYLQDGNRFLRAAYRHVLGAGANEGGIEPAVVFGVFKEMHLRKNEPMASYRLRKKLYDRLPRIAERLENGDGDYASDAAEARKMHAALAGRYSKKREARPASYSKPILALQRLTPFMPDVFHRGLDCLGDHGLRYTFGLAVSRMGQALAVRRRYRKAR